MAKALRVAAMGSGLVLAGVLALAWFVVRAGLDPHREELADWLSAETGFEVRIDGRLGLGLAFRPRLTVAGLSVWSESQGERVLLARMDELGLVVSPLTLLFEGPRVDELRLRGAEIFLVRDASGRELWMMGHEDDSEEGFDLKVKRVRVENSSIRFRNELAGAETQLDLARLAWNAEEAGKPGRLKVDGELEGLPFSFEASLRAEPPRAGTPQRYAVSLEGELLGAKVGIAGSVRSRDLRNADMALDLQAPSLAPLARWGALDEIGIPDLGPLHATATLLGVDGVLGVRDIDVRIGDRKRAWLEATGSAHNLEGARDMKLQLEFGTLDLRHLRPWVKEPPVELDHLTGSAVLSDRDGTLGLETLLLKGGKKEILDLQVEGRIDRLEGMSEIDLQVKLHTRYLADLGRLVFTPLPLAGPLDFSGHLLGARERVSVEALSLHLGESQLDGSIVYRQPRGQRPSLQARLRSARMRVEDIGIFPGAREHAQIEQVPGTGSDEELPFESLKLFDADLRLEIERLVGRAGFDAERVSLEAGVERGLLDLRRFALEFQGGHFEARMRVDAQPGPPSITLQGTGKGMRMGRVLAQFLEEDLLTGTADLSFDLRSSGASRRALTNALSGPVVVLLNDGRIASAWANAMVKDATRALFSSTWKQGDQPFECLATSLTARDGLIAEAVLLLDAEQTRIVGGGSIDLRNERLDLAFTPYPRDPGLFSLAAKVRVRGAFSAPEVTTDPLSIPVNAGRSLFRKALRLSGAGAMAAIALPRRGDAAPCDDLRAELSRVWEGGGDSTGGASAIEPTTR